MAWKVNNLSKYEAIAGIAYGLFVAAWVITAVDALFFMAPILVWSFNGGLALSFALAIALRIYVAIKRVKMRGSVLLNVFVVMGILWAVFVCQVVSTKRSRAEYQAQQARKPVSDVNVPPEILVMVINARDLQPYLHPEVEGRVPLVITNVLLPPGSSVSKFGVPVRLVDEQEAMTVPHLKITWFLQVGNLARVDLVYDVEGIAARVNFDQDSAGQWQVVSCDIVERKSR